MIAYGRLKEPDWYFLMSFPSGDLVWSAVKTASWVLLFGVLGVLAQVLLLYRMMSHAIVRPLGDLADAHRSGDLTEAVAIETRHDEIGALARTLRRQREGNVELLRSLEDRVARADGGARARQPGQVDVPGQYVPRAAHAAQRRDRHR